MSGMAYDAAGLLLHGTGPPQALGLQTKVAISLLTSLTTAVRMLLNASQLSSATGESAWSLD